MEIEGWKLKIGFSFAVLTFLVLVPVRPCAAQDGTRPPVEHKQAISTNPLYDVFGFWNVDYSRKVNDSLTAGVTASTIDFSDARYTAVNATLRFYPQGAALSGFFIGGKLGVHRVTEDFFDRDDFSETALGAGVDLGYEWLFGRRRNYQFGLGAGVSRIFGLDADVDQVYVPNLRANFGIAF
jgi:hypothetical protein